MFLLIGVVSQEAAHAGGTPERPSRTLRELFCVPRGDILAARTDGPTKDQGTRP